MWAQGATTNWLFVLFSSIYPLILASAIQGRLISIFERYFDSLELVYLNYPLFYHFNASVCTNYRHPFKAAAPDKLATKDTIDATGDGAEGTAAKATDVCVFFELTALSLHPQSKVAL